MFFFICATPALPQQTPDIPKTFTRPTAEYDYLKSEVMIPMRDGVKLHTVIVIPKGLRGRRSC
jgi:predicted acyl esterase